MNIMNIYKTYLNNLSLKNSTLEMIPHYYHYEQNHGYLPWNEMLWIDVSAGVHIGAVAVHTYRRWIRYCVTVSVGERRYDGKITLPKYQKHISCSTANKISLHVTVLWSIMNLGRLDKESNWTVPFFQIHAY